MNFYLRAKHWQLFVILMIALVAPVLLFGEELPNPITFFFIMIVYMLVIFGWIVSIGISANKRLQPEFRKSPKLMLFGLLYTVVYLGLYLTVLFPEPGSGELPNVGLILPLHIFAMICVFYCLVYSSKQLVTLQLGKEPSFFEYSGPFFGFWFYPLGVWFIQPKVNELLATGT